MPPAPSPRIAIVGAGIIGSALAWSLAMRGAQVLVVDEGVAANRATRGSFAWINAHRPGDSHYFDLRLHSMRLWRDAAARIDGLPMRLGGALNWEEPPETIEEVARALDEGGNPARLVSRDRIAALEPNLSAPPEIAIDAPDEGVADPDSIAQAFLDAATAAGAQLRGDVTVRGIATVAGRVTGLETDAGLIGADRVVIAAGAATPALLRGVDVALPMRTPLGLLVRTNPVPKVSNRILTSADLHVWQMDDGRLILGEDFGGTPVGENRAETEARVLARAQGYFAGTGTLRVHSSTLAGRPVPQDGYPCVGPVPGIDGLTVATMHSGITLAPVMAAHLCVMLLDDADIPALAPYGIARFN